MTDILQATQQQINDAANQVIGDKPSGTPPPPPPVDLKGPTPPSGSAAGRVEPPLPTPKPTAAPPLPSQKTGSAIDLTSKTEPMQSPPLPIPPPEMPTSFTSSGWSPEKAKLEKEKLNNEAPIANIPQYDNYAPTQNLPPKPVQLPPKVTFTSVAPPVIVTPAAGNSAPPPPIAPPPPPNIAITSQSPSIVPPPKKSRGKGPLIVILLLLAAAIPLGVYFVTQSERFTQLTSQAVGDLRYLCTPNACATGGCNQPCTANLAGTAIIWDGNAYQVPGNGYAIKNKCYGVESGATNSACSCPLGNITDPTGAGDTCNLPNVERYFVRGPATLGWDETFCGTQQVDITVGSGNPSYFHSKEDTRPQTCAVATTPTPAPQCDNGALFKVYENDGVTDITASLRNGTKTLLPGDFVILAVTKVSGADHARFRLQGYGDWVDSNINSDTEFRTQVVVPENFTGTNGAFEADICADSTSANCR